MVDVNLEVEVIASQIIRDQSELEKSWPQKHRHLAKYFPGMHHAELYGRLKDEPVEFSEIYLDVVGRVSTHGIDVGNSENEKFIRESLENIWKSFGHRELLRWYIPARSDFCQGVSLSLSSSILSLRYERRYGFDLPDGERMHKLAVRRARSIKATQNP